MAQIFQSTVSANSFIVKGHGLHVQVQESAYGRHHLVNVVGRMRVVARTALTGKAIGRSPEATAPLRMR